MYDVKHNTGKEEFAVLYPSALDKGSWRVLEFREDKEAADHFVKYIEELGMEAKLMNRKVPPFSVVAVDKEGDQSG